MRPKLRVASLGVKLFRLVLCSLMVVLPSALPAARGLGGPPSATPAPAARPPANRQAGRRADEVVVRFGEGVSETSKAAARAAARAQLKRRLRGASRAERLALEAGQDPATAAERLRLLPGVELAEPNYLIEQAQAAPDDPRLPEQWALSNEGQTGGSVGADIGARAAWQTTTGSPATVVAVVDGGVDFSHPDLADNAWVNRRERANGRDDDHNGYVDDEAGWDWATDSQPSGDPAGHGTAVAGLIAAEGDNGLGTAGVMWRASLMSLRVLDAAGTGDVADAVEAIDYAVEAGAQVVNCSWGTEADSQILREAVERAASRGVLVVASAGNGSRDLDAAPYYPASFDLPNLIAVAATDHADALADFSNWGASRVALAAPGVDLLTTAPGGGYTLARGTSFAAALTSGVAGLVKTGHPRLSAAETRAAVLWGGRRVEGLRTFVASGGVVSAAGALEAARTFGNGRGNDGSGVRRVEPPTPPAGGEENLPDDPAGRESHVPQPPPPGLDSNAPPICDDCFQAPGSDPQFSNARALLKNETGRPNVDVGSKNFNYAVPLVSLPGRAGLDLNLTLYYNSLVWARQGNSVQYNPDTGYPSPGFRLGFPVVQKQFTDSDTGRAAYMLLTPSGGRVKLPLKSADTFEATDGSYTQLKLLASGWVRVRTSDGTSYTFEPTAVGHKRCREVKDRNGNYISIAYDAAGRLSSATDTLGRVVNFVYNGNGNLFQITQSRGAGLGQVLAQFAYGDVTIRGPYFVDQSGALMTMRYPTSAFSALTQVWTPSGVTHKFRYTDLGQVFDIRRVAPDGTLLSETWYNLPAAPAVEGDRPGDPNVRPAVQNIALNDTPRFSQRSDRVAYGVLHETKWVSTFYVAAPDDSVTTVTAPGGTVYKEFFATTGWQKGLTTVTEVWAGGVRKKRTTTAWTQDDTGPESTVARNARPAETNVYDSDGNRRQTAIAYATVSGVSLPSEVREYGGTHAEVSLLRRANTTYKWDAAYLDRRIIGLVDGLYVYDGSDALVSKVTYGYDWDFYGDLFRDTPAPATRHDRANYGPSFIYGRGNLSETARWDADDPTNFHKITETKWRVSSTGTVLLVRDQDWHQTSLDYDDAFSDGVDRNTFA